MLRKRGQICGRPLGGGRAGTCSSCLGEPQKHRRDVVKILRFPMFFHHFRRPTLSEDATDKRFSGTQMMRVHAQTSLLCFHIPCHLISGALIGLSDLYENVEFTVFLLPLSQSQ